MNDQMTKCRDAAALSFACHAVAERRRVIRESFVIRHSSFVICWTVLLMVIAQMCCSALAQAQTPNMTGTWNVEITFANEEHRAIRFDAQNQGKGILLLIDPRAKVWGAPTSFEAKWSVDKDSVSFSAPVEFMLGNVGRDPGTLTCKGKFETANLISGEVEFSPSVGDRPSKHGTFKAVRSGT
jgi:hypothetical protein